MTMPRLTLLAIVGLLIVGCASRSATPAVMVQGGSRPVFSIPGAGLTPGPVPIDMASERPTRLEAMPLYMPVAEKSLQAGVPGSRSRPIRVDGELNEAEYIRRLRCPGGESPAFYSHGNLGPGDRAEDSHLLNVFTIECPDVMPFLLYMDRDHVVRAMDPIPGFTLLPFLPGRAASGCPPEVTADPDSNAAWVFTSSELEKLPATKGLPGVVNLRSDSPGMYARFVVDTLGRVELESLRLAAPVSAREYQNIRKWAADLRFTPGEHRLGCKVRALVEMGVLKISMISR